MVAELFFRLNIQQHDSPGLVDHHHRIRSGFQQPAIFRSRLFTFTNFMADHSTNASDEAITECGRVLNYPNPRIKWDFVFLLATSMVWIFYPGRGTES